MSRSYKKHPVFKFVQGWAKKSANKKVRRTKHLSNGNAYKKLYWDVIDQRGYESWASCRTWCYERFCQWEIGSRCGSHWNYVDENGDFDEEKAYRHWLADSKNK